MAELFQPLGDFPGMAVLYDPTQNPFFRKIVEENLGIMKRVPVGQALLGGIQVAQPKVRGDFPAGLNVVLRPLRQMMYNQAGTKPVKDWGQGGAYTVSGMAQSTHPLHNLRTENGVGELQDCFWKDGTSLNKAVDVNSTSGGKGTVCWVEFSNAQMITSQGERCVPYIVLAHELIHSLHCLEGVHAGSEEEKWTSGMGQYANDPMTEQAFRAALGQPPRLAY